MDYERIRRQCEAFARKKGFPQDAEDFASFAVLYSIERNDPDVYVERRFVDYLRKHYGRSGTPGGSARQRATLRPSEYVEGGHGSESPVGFEIDESGKYLAGLSDKDRLIYVLTQKHEVDQAAIADSLGVSAARVSQVLKGIQRRISERVKATLPRYTCERKGCLEAIFDQERQEMEFGAYCELEAFQSFEMEGLNEAGFGEWIAPEAL